MGKTLRVFLTVLFVTGILCSLGWAFVLNAAAGFVGPSGATYSTNLGYSKMFLTVVPLCLLVAIVALNWRRKN